MGQFTTVLDIGPEVLQPVNLLQIYGNRVVTLFGFTGTFDELAPMCGRNLADPSMQDAVNTFIVKAANESGMEINPEHEEMFARVVEETGAERKFVVAVEPKTKSIEPKTERSSVDQKVGVTDLSATKKNEAKEQNIHNRAVDTARVQKTSQISAAIIEATRKRQNQDYYVVEPYSKSINTEEKLVVIKPVKTPDKQFTTVIQNEQQIVVMAPVKTPIEYLASKRPVPVNDIKGENPKLPSSSTVNEVIDISKKKVVTDSVCQANDSLEDEDYIKNTDDEFQFEDSARSTDQELSIIEVGSEDIVRQEEFDRVFDQMVEQADFSENSEESSHEVISSSAESWGELLFESPELMFDDFVFGLESFAEKIAALDISNYETSANHDSDCDNHAAIESQVSPIFQLVAERLLSADDKQNAMEKVQKIVGAIHGIRILEQRVADPSQIEFAKEKLLEFSAELFLQLGIDYDIEMVELFAWTLLRPEYIPLLTKSKNYEELGTNESKQEPNQYFDPSFPSDRNPRHYILGGLAVLYTNIISDLRVPALN